VKHGGKEERNALAMELQPQWREMMESKYSKVSFPFNIKRTTKC